MSTRVTALTALLVCGVGLALGDVVPKLPGDFDASAGVETFEAIAGVQLPLLEWGEGFYSPQSDLPAPFVLPSGVTYSSTTGDDAARIFDYGAPGASSPEMWGWGLSIEGGNIHYQTPFPSGTAFFTGNAGFDPATEPPATITFTFAQPVNMVGAYVEAGKWLEVGMDGVVTLEAFDGLGNSLGLLSVVTDGVSNAWEGPPFLNGLDTWIGLGTQDGLFSIHSIAFHGYNVVADDLMFATVPEPATLTTLALALVCLMRRR